MTDFDPRKMLGGEEAPKFERIKLGSGVVGKITNSVLALFGLMTVIAWGLSKEPVDLLYLLILAVFVFVFYALSIRKHPVAAALYGRVDRLRS